MYVCSDNIVTGEFEVDMTRKLTLTRSISSSWRSSVLLSHLITFALIAKEILQTLDSYREQVNRT